MVWPPARSGVDLANCAAKVRVLGVDEAEGAGRGLSLLQRNGIRLLGHSLVFLDSLLEGRHIELPDHALEPRRIVVWVIELVPEGFSRLKGQQRLILGLT